MHNNIYFLEKKSLPYERETDFTNGLCISFLLFGNVLWTINMRPYGCQKNINYILYVHWFYLILFMSQP
jgi:hypothetical protein